MRIRNMKNGLNLYNKMKISDLVEFELIEKIRKKINLSNEVIKGIGDDTAVLKYNEKLFMLFTTDSMVENDHFNLKWFKPEQIGKKAIESNVSDIAAMGGFPRYALISLSLPKNTDLKFVENLYNGINKSSKKYNIHIVGGNLTHSNEIMITVSLIGFVEKKFLCLRESAKKDDLICVSGDLGRSKAGLELLKNGKTGKSIFYYLNPMSRLKLARFLAKNKINAMEDVSDGLATEVFNICKESNKGAIIFKEKIPLRKSTIEDGKKVNLNPIDYALYGGEDFELVFSINRKYFESLNCKEKISVVGQIKDKKEGIFLMDKNKKKDLGLGFDHFKQNLRSKF